MQLLPNAMQLTPLLDDREIYHSHRYARIPGSLGIRERTVDRIRVQVIAFKAIDCNPCTDRPGSEIHTAYENQSSYDIFMITGRKKCRGTIVTGQRLLVFSIRSLPMGHEAG